MAFPFNSSLLSGYFQFGNNHFFLQFFLLENILQMFIYSGNSYPKELCHSLLGTPYCTVLYNNLYLALLVGHAIKQELYLVFLSIRLLHPR